MWPCVAWVQRTDYAPDMDAATAALIGAGIGVVGGGISGAATARMTGRLQRQSSREARSEDRRAKGYLEAASFLMELRGALRAAAAKETDQTPVSDSMLKAAIQAAASIAVFGTGALQLDFRAVTDATVAFIELVNRKASTSPEAAEVLAQADQAIDAVTARMNRELHP